MTNTSSPGRLPTFEVEEVGMRGVETVSSDARGVPTHATCVEGICDRRPAVATVGAGDALRCTA